jgi:catechol 2,3-dioxygenase-like lactoylglutathione lyase family enzyme
LKYMGMLIAVKDLKKSRFLYETILEQKVETDFGVNLSFAGGFALHDGTHYRGLIGGREISSRPNNFELYFEEDDLERVQAELEKHGLELIHRVREQPWRQWVLRFYDYDGNIVEIGETMPHLVRRLHAEGVPREKIRDFTGWPLEKIDETTDRPAAES